MNNIRYRLSALVVSVPVVCLAISAARAQYPGVPAGVPSEIKAVFDQPRYSGAIWGLRVIDLETRQALIDLEPRHKFLIGSVRKVFTVGELLNEIGPTHTFNTP